MQQRLRIHSIQHVDFEGLGSIGEWAHLNNAVLSSSRTDLAEKCPSELNFDWLVVLGGPMDLTDAKPADWTMDVLNLITRCIVAKKKVLGICLGAQFVAKALGSKITKNIHDEIGWHVLQFNGQARLHPLFAHFGQQSEELQWHGNTFSLPERAVSMASSTACKNQAFVFEERTVGIQFHPEWTPEIVARVAAPEMPFVTKTFVQSIEEILDQKAIDRFAQMKTDLFTFLDRLLEV